VYGRGFFPFAEPIALEAGDRVEVALRADLTGADYVWSWTTTVWREGGEPGVRLQQSTFYGGPMSADRIRRRATGFTPVLSSDGEIDAAILHAMMAGQCTVEQIAGRLMQQFPQHFQSRAQAAARVSDLAERYSR
jgi:hypothetical protein